MMRGYLLCVLLTVPACKGTSSGEGSAGAMPHTDFIKIEPGSPRLDFVKIEAVKESDNAGSLTLSGKIGFDEDHTQRLGSPIHGRVPAGPGTLAARVPGGPPPVGASAAP